ncbi:MAG: hypothetical protein AUK53_05765 [Betaproteobacteria bacterium CG2_30_59_46]|nr:MAG: hypothetical protein AUK53_05765 [Betaproteobacteria bacterium CG2_30_59_46]
MQRFEEMTRQELAELLDRLQAEKQPQKRVAETRERLLHELQVHQVELEMQNRELQEASRRLEESRNRYADLYDFAPLGYFTFDEKGLILEANLTGATLLGRDRSRLVGMPFLSFLPRQEHGAFLNHLHVCLTGGAQVSAEFSLSLADEKTLDAEMVSVPTCGADGHAASCRTALSDITGRRQAEQKLHLAAKVLENTQEGVMVTDARNRIVAVNPAFCKVTGYSAGEAIGQTPSLLKSGIHDGEFYRRLWAALQETGHWQGEVWNRRKNGEVYPEWLNLSVIRNDEGEIEHYVGIFSDIASQMEMKKRLHELAYYDELTGLANRHLLLDRLQLELLQSRRSGNLMALLFLDLDRFKVINDTLGHAADDRLLVLAAERLGGCVRDGDTLARMGGDEFVALLRNIDDKPVVAHVAARMVDAMVLPFFVDGHELFVTASIGIALYPGDGDDIDALIRNADTAMYRAKDSGRNNYQFYAAAMNEEAQQRLRLETDLRHATERNELFVLYQPQADISVRRIVGAEALVRWQHPGLGLIPPMEFIPIAEESGLIVQVGEWVLRAVCRQNKAWQDAGLPPVRVAVNLSPLQFRQQDLFAVVSAALKESGLEPQYLELELTESIFMEDIEAAIVTLRQIKNLGVALSIDDFGTGFSSLSYLKRFPIDTLKIDQSFVRDSPGNPDDSAIVEAIIAMAHSLKLKAIAEGEETEQQLAFLRERGCEMMQGYLCARPLAPDQFAEILVTHHRGGQP